ncbi:MAG: dihydrodipicolinate synthase family protein [Planctomycetota bacterium]
MDKSVFDGCIPALMTPCLPDRTPDVEALTRKGIELMDAGMSGVVYCGSMGDWPLLTDEQRQQGVAKLCSSGVPVVVGTGAMNTASAVAHTRHAVKAGAKGLMVIPRVLSRGSSVAAQQAHFSAILAAAPDIPAVIYNSPYYGYETKAELFFQLRHQFRNLVGFKEFGGAESLSYAAEHITGADDELILMVGVDTQVFHGYVNCNAGGAITGIGNAIPKVALKFVELCQLAAKGDVEARRLAKELDQALMVLSTFDEGPDLVLFYKHLMVLNGDEEYTLHFNETDALTTSQKRFVEVQYDLFQKWWVNWPGKTYQTQ